MLPKKRIQVVMVDENGVEHVVSSEDAPAQAPAFGESERASIKGEVLALAAKAGAEMHLGEFRHPQIIDKLMRSARGGMYKPLEHTVYMNMLLHHDLKTYRETLVHEVAHAVVIELTKHYRAQGRRCSGSQWGHHGLAWKTVMRRMGAEANPYHDYDVVKEMPGKWLAQVCACGYRHQAGKRAIANAIAKGKKWRCGKCQRPIDMNAWGTAPAAVAAVAGGKRRHAAPSLASQAKALRKAMRK